MLRHFSKLRCVYIYTFFTSEFGKYIGPKGIKKGS